MNRLIVNRFIALLSLALGTMVFFQAAPVFAGAYDDLTAAEKSTIQSGGLVFRTKDDPSSVFPKMYIYARVDATPEECLAVYTDFELQKTYVPGLIKSVIAQRVNASTTNVDYEMKIPFPLKNEQYSAQVVVSTYDDGAGYRADWKLLKASTTKDTVGNSRFEQLGTGSLIAYYNFITPGSSLAGVVKERAIKQVKDTISALRVQIEDERANHPAQLAKQIEILRNALKPRQ